jgi:hypothetical protein
MAFFCVSHFFFFFVRIPKYIKLNAKTNVYISDAIKQLGQKNAASFCLSIVPCWCPSSLIYPTSALVFSLWYIWLLICLIMFTL